MRVKVTLFVDVPDVLPQWIKSKEEYILLKLSEVINEEFEDYETRPAIRRCLKRLSLTYEETKVLSKCPTN